MDGSGAGCVFAAVRDTGGDQEFVAGVEGENLIVHCYLVLALDADGVLVVRVGVRGRCAGCTGNSA